MQMFLDPWVAIREKMRPNIYMTNQWEFVMHFLCLKLKHFRFCLDANTVETWQ